MKREKDPEYTVKKDSEGKLYLCVTETKEEKPLENIVQEEAPKEEAPKKEKPKKKKGKKK